MKKIITITTLALMPFWTMAQETSQSISQRIPEDYVRIFATIAFMVIVFVVFLSFTKTMLNHKLKSKMLDKGVSEKVIESFLQPVETDTKTQAIKWCFILAALGVSLGITSYLYQNLLVHSISIVADSLSLAYLAYWYYLKKS